MKRVTLVIVPILLAGLVMGYFEVRRKGRELAQERAAASVASDPPSETVFRANVAARPPVPGSDLITPPAPDADPGMLSPPSAITLAQANEPGRLPSGAAVRLRREGTAVANLVGAVERQGVRFLFRPADGSTPLTLLENQVLQRVSFLIEGTNGSPTPIRWSVDGVVTEYLGANFLLLRRAVVDRS